MIDVAKDVRAAESRIRPFVRETYLEESLYYGQLGEARVFLKCENLQHTGSFTARGALSRVLSLTPDELRRGVVTASTGNHGAAVAYALREVARADLPGTVYQCHGSGLQPARRRTARCHGRPHAR